MKEAEFYERNGFKDETALGMYLPNTYNFEWDTTAEGFRDKMLFEYKKFWNDSRLCSAQVILPRAAAAAVGRHTMIRWRRRVRRR